MKAIYLVHDDQESPEQRRNFLEMAGYKVVLLQSAEECMRLIDKEKPCLVLSDILIHGMNGFELCGRIRDQFSKTEVPVILCSAIYTGRAFHEEAVAVGAQRLLDQTVQAERAVGPHHAHDLGRRAAASDARDSRSLELPSKGAIVGAAWTPATTRTARSSSTGQSCAP